MIRDPEIIKNVLIRDFANFCDRGIHCDEEEEPLHNHLIRMRGDDKWRNLRMKLSPMFTMSKLKMIIAPIYECANKFSQILDQTNGEPFNMKELSERFTMDVIGCCAFGMDTLAMENSNSIFLHMGRRIFKFRYQSIIRRFFPTLPKYWIKMFNLKYLEKDVEDFFLTIIQKAIQLREDTSVKRNDLLELLLALRKGKGENGTDLNENDVSEDGNLKNDIELTPELVIAQCFVFFAAGFETSSTALGNIMLELALNPSIQDKVREEIRQVLDENDGQVTAESLKEMTYCDMVIAEALRKHPPVGMLFRQCNKSYKIPDTEATIPEKTPVILSTYGLHMDPEYYEKPNEFYPEHFTEEAKKKRHKCCYLPFGEGGRICIGERFAKLEIKIGMISLIKNYIFEVSSKMKLPVEYNFEINLGLMSPKEIWLQCRRV